MDILKFLRQKLVPERTPVTPPEVKKVATSKEDADMWKAYGISNEALRQVISDQNLIIYERSCLRGDTRISLLDGTTPTIKEMAENNQDYVGKYVLSVNPTTLEIEPDKILAATKTRLNAEMIRVHLDNENHIDCTPDHKFMLRNGTFKEAKDLAQGESLMPLYLKKPAKVLKDYLMVYKPKGGWTYVHWLVDKFFNGKRPKGVIVHHKGDDRCKYDKVNNDPSCLERMSKSDHNKIHFNEVSHKEHLQKLHRKMVKPRETRECLGGCGLTKTVIVTSDWRVCRDCANKLNAQKPFWLQKRKDAQQALWNSPEYREQQTKAIWNIKRYRRPLLTKTCVVCGCEFTTKVGNRQSCSKRDCVIELIRRKTTGVKKTKSLKNHKVLFVETLTVREDVYDISTERNHNFPTVAGVFVHNSVYQVVDRSLNHALMCFTGDTKVALLDGRDVSMEQLAKEYEQGKVNHVYSIDLDGKKIVRSPIKRAWKTGTKEILKVVLDNGEEIRCTLDHRFMLRDGSYKEAQQLKPDDSLMPLYRYVDKEYRKGYWRLYDPFNARQAEPKHYSVQYTYFNKNRGTGNHVHHSYTNFKDSALNKLDDSPENHSILSKKDHSAVHTKPQEARFAQAIRTIQNHYGVSREEAIRIYEFNHKKVPCPVCTDLMDPRRKTCSYECRNSAMRGRAPHNKGKIGQTAWNKGLTKEDIRVAKYATKPRWNVGLTKETDERVMHMAESKVGGTPWNKGIRNHKVKEVVRLNAVADVYDLTIEPFHNFALSAGVFVHNSAACVAFADTACQRSPLHGSTVWVTSDNKEYRYQLEKMLDVINIEEVIYDWAWTTAAFGDLFVECFGEPGVGLICVNDDNHPINVSRVDHNGRLVGFFQTPLGYATTDTRKLLAPWDHVHFRLLGAKKRRPLYADQQYCIAGNTRINLLDNTTPTIKEITENLAFYKGKSVLTINPQTLNLEVGQIVDAKKTRLNAQLVRVHLDNDQYVDTTPDHKFMLRDGGYKEAQDLFQGESLMPLYTREDSRKRFKDYQQVYNPADGEWHFIHRLVAKQTYGKTPKGSIVHHWGDERKLFDKKNNDPKCLEVVTKAKHMEIHANNLDELRQDPEWKEAHRKSVKDGVARSKAENPELWDEHGKKISQKAVERFEDPAYRDKFNRAMEERNENTEWKRNIGEGSKKVWSDKEYHDKQAKRTKEGQQKAYSDPAFRHHCTNLIKEAVNEIKELTCKYCGKKWVGKYPGLAGHAKGCKVSPKNLEKAAVLNHKVVIVEWLTEREDTYDIEISGNHNFPVTAGVFISNSEFRTVSIMTPDARRLTSKYGTSILADALPIWKRLRLAEDSIMMARIMKSPQRFLFKVTIPEDNANAEAVANLVDQYMTEIKRCLVGDTKIALLNNTNPTIKEMAENKEKYVGKYVYSVNPITKAIEPDKIVDVAKTVVDATVMRVHLDNEEYVECTPDHRFMMRDGSFKEAKDLVQGDSLMPLYTKVSSEGRRQVLNPKTGKFPLVYKLVSECIDGKTPKDCVVHHENENKLDDDPSNLKIVTKHDHMSIHHLFTDKIIAKRGSIQAWNKGLTKETDERVAKYAKSVSETQQVQYDLGFRKSWNDGLTKETDRRMQVISDKVKQSNPMGRPEVRAKASKSKMGNHNKPVAPKETRVCGCGCGETFECKISSDQAYVQYHHRKNKKNSQDHNRKIALSHIGKPGHKQTFESRKKISLGGKISWAKRKHTVLNHKVISVEVLPYTVDTYDISTEKNHNFALSCGIFVHNSRALNLDSNNPGYLDRFNAMASCEDLIFPVWGDSNNLTVETLGGDTDIKWIADVDKLENQLITALKVPKQLLAGFSGEGGGGFEGGTALERMDIRFARQARRVQRSLINGLTRMAQIHLAWQGLDPDLDLFQIHMSQSSSAEEVELQDALGKSVDATRGLYDMLQDMVGVDLNKKELLTYFNEKFFKLSDLDLDTLYLKGDAKAIQGDHRDVPVPGVEEPAAEGGEEEQEATNPFRESKESLRISDLSSPLPNHKTGQLWESQWKDAPINVTSLNEGTK